MNTAFGLTIFSGALLLFIVQPIIARYILPWFGGSPAVWTTCMLFFQLLLLGGYAYAHWSAQRLAARRQVIVHLTLLGIALAFLPIAPGEHWKPPDGVLPTGRILVLLLCCLGAPYLVLSATGPLMQAWFSRASGGASPYRLYAVSNAGSLLGLLVYPLWVEAHSTRLQQAWGWSAGFVVFAALAAWCGRFVWRSGGCCPQAAAPASGGGEEGEAASPGAAARAGWLWFALPACASVLLLAVTNTICLDIAVIPFLWVLPLSLYLLSFIICFDSPRWYRRRFWLPALAVSLVAMLWMMFGTDVPIPGGPWTRPLRRVLAVADDLSLFKTIAIHLGSLFVCCMVCHGETYRLRPPPRLLTAYFLTVAAGGAFGGVFVALIAPLVFRGYFELHAGLCATALLVALVLLLDRGSPIRRGWRAWAWAGIVPALALLGIGLWHDAARTTRGAVEISRGFYGVLKVTEGGAPESSSHELRLQHGSTLHGMQFTHPDRRRVPTTYYTPSSGIGMAMRSLQKRPACHIGVVGLGAGTMASFGRAGDTVRFYEIDPLIVRVARARFTYLADTPARVEVVLGDGRLAMEREAPQQFDILVLDAFSSDAIPVHLMTREAFAIYLRHLRPDGVLAVNITNRVLDVRPVVRLLAAHFGLGIAIVSDEADDWLEEEDGEDDATYASDWALLTRNGAFLSEPPIAAAAAKPPASPPRIRMWTDEEYSLLHVLDLESDAWLAWLGRKDPPGPASAR